MEQWKQWLGFGAFMVFFVVAACVVSLWPQPGGGVKPQVVLGDGRTVRLEQVTFGRTHEFRTGNPWLERIRRLLPPPLRSGLGPPHPRSSTTYGEDVLIPWLSIETVAGGSSPQWRDFEIVSATGQRFDINGWGGGDEIDGRRMIRPNVHVFPRREKDFLLRGEVDGQAWELRVPNPVRPLKVVEWTTSPLPITIETNGFAFTLASVRLNRNPSSLWTTPKYEVTQAGEPRDDWFRFSTTWSDATGNQSYQTPPTNEPAWRADTRVYRTPRAPWATNEFLSLAVEQLPPTGEMRSLHGPVMIGTERFLEIFVAGPGRFVISNDVLVVAEPHAGGSGGGSSYSSSSGSGSTGSYWKLERKSAKPWLLCKMAAPADTHVSLFVRVGGDPWQEFYSNGSSHGSGHVFRYHELNVPADARDVELRLAPQTPLRLQYTIAPDQLTRP